MSWSLYTVEYIKTRLSGDTSLCFSFQLAICIERKCQMNEDYQDCIGSVDHIDSMTEVTYLFFLLILVIRLIGVSLPLLLLFLYFCKLVLFKLQEESVIGDDLLSIQTPSEIFSGKVDR